MCQYKKCLTQLDSVIFSSPPNVQQYIRALQLGSSFISSYLSLTVSVKHYRRLLAHRSKLIRTSAKLQSFRAERDALRAILAIPMQAERGLMLRRLYALDNFLRAV